MVRRCSARFALAAACGCVLAACVALLPTPAAGRPWRDLLQAPAAQQCPVSPADFKFDFAPVATACGQYITTTE